MIRLFFLFFVMFLSVAGVSHASNQVVLNKANLDMKAGHYAVALESLQQLVNRDNNDYQAWFLLGVARTHEQHYRKAIEAFRQVIALRPDLAEPHNNLAAIYSALDDPETAAHELEQALAKRPDFVTAEENLADLYVKLALKHYRNSLEKAPSPVVRQRYMRLLDVLKPIRNEAGLVKSSIVGHPKPQTTAVANAKTERSGEHKVMEKTERLPLPASVMPVNTVESRKRAPIISTPSSASVMPVSTVKSRGNSVTSVLDALETWRLAWSNQDVHGYFAAYATDFKPPSRFPSLKSWKKYKRKVIRDKKFIRVNFEQVNVDVRPDGNLATVTMLQHFHSNSYNSDDLKKITMKHQGNGWKITKEILVQ